MRALVLMLLLAACSTRPEVDWPKAKAPPAPALLPQAELGAPPRASDPGPSVAARAAALKLWATASP